MGVSPPWSSLISVAGALLSCHEHQNSKIWVPDSQAISLRLCIIYSPSFWSFFGLAILLGLGAGGHQLAVWIFLAFTIMSANFHCQFPLISLLSICLPVSHPSIHLSIYPSIHPSIFYPDVLLTLSFWRILIQVKRERFANTLETETKSKTTAYKKRSWNPRQCSVNKMLAKVDSQNPH